METSTKKHLSISVYYLLAALLWSGFVFLELVRALADWHQQVTLSPASLVVIHSLILGTLFTTAIGVMWQFVPIAFQAKPMPRHVLYWHLPIHTLSVVVMVYGFLNDQMPAVAVGGTGFTLALLAFLAQLLKSYFGARNRTPVHRTLVVPLLGVLAVVTVGLWQAWQPAAISSTVLALHVWFGAFAAWGTLVMVMSYKLVPMFTLSHGYRVHLPRVATLYLSGLVLVSVGITLPMQVLMHSALFWIGLCATELGHVWFGVDILKILKTRRGKRIVRPIRFALVSLLVLWVTHGGLLIAVAFGWTQGVLLFGYLYLFGGLLPLTASYMQKMVPFLWFEYRFSKRPERKTAPGIDEMINPTSSRVSAILYAIGAFSGWVAIWPWVRSSVVIVMSMLACIGMGVGLILLFLAFIRVITIGGPRPADTPAPAPNGSDG